ncbi:hypothetical protein ILUMI_21604 [Ignelater luminosus]|uniref:Peptidase M13 N-terminal domain-containing protein n=1 Tax=Ignelater luminosus TaxID=2038154 RepID=A0A8K0FXU4_IGNLU|nr:hypothetical protein ILUMI_21604 [Ignelater luminosus]
MSGRYKQGNCWDDRSCIEKILICAAVTTILIVIVFVILLTLYLTRDSFVPSPTAANIFAPEACNHQTCLNHSTEIIERIDQAVNPCEDFYKFSCGNLLRKANGNEHLGPFYVIQSKSKRQIEDMYGEPIEDDEHKVVKISKMFYKNCLNETKIKEESLWNVKGVITKLGGWPVIEGTKWDESRFWWIQTCFQLRRLGYFYASLLDISVVVDPADKDRSIYKVSIPSLRDSHEYFRVRDKLGLMIDTAIALGAEKERAISEMSGIYDFLLNLREQSYLRRNEDPHQRITVGEFQNQYEFINWLEFINNIIGPGVRIFKDDYVLFPSVNSIFKWFEYISTVPKRTQANYMIWKVIEELIPYLNISYNSKIGIRHGDYNTRSEFCTKLIRKKFAPSPIDIMYVRKYLLPEKKNKVEELLKNLKLELLKLLEKHNWVDYIDKQLAIERINGLNEVIGAPGNYFDDDIFEDLDFELSHKTRSNNCPMEFTNIFCYRGLFS